MKLLLRGGSSRLLVLGMVAALAVGCTSVGGAPSAFVKVPASGGVPSIEPFPEASCYVRRIEVEPIPQTMVNMSRVATIIVVGSFNGYGKAVWNTPGGVRPSSAEFGAKPARLARPLLLKIDTTVRGDAASVVHAMVPGGTLGCDTISYSNAVDLVAGSRYVFFLAPVSDSEGQIGSSLSLGEAWPVGTDDVVQTRLEGPVPLSDLATVVKDNPYTGSP